MSKTLTISDQVARQAYKDAPESLKKILVENFGEKFFSAKITDRIQTFDDILSIGGRTMESLIRPGDRIDEIARRKCELIAEVYNEGTILDPMNTDQYKYYPYFYIDKSSGFGLSCHDYVRWHSVSSVGVRLCFKDGSHAADAGKKFTSIYAEMLIK